MKWMFGLLQEWSQDIVGTGAKDSTIRGSNPGRRQRFLAVEPVQPPVWFFAKGNTAGGVRLTTPIYWWG
jgi:hypothetical protein